MMKYSLQNTVGRISSFDYYNDHVNILIFCFY